ncbi:MAG: VWA domain-containing protein [Chloroflexota bacterium]
MSQFHFADLAYFWLLPLALLPLLAQFRAKSFTFSQIRLVVSTKKSWRLRVRPFLPYLQTIGLLLLVAALARPQHTRTEQILFESETAVLFALDISNSMKAQDLQPNRLTAAKEMIATVIAERPTTQFGLVLFAQNAYIQLPPTYDHALFLQTLDQVNLAEPMGLPDGTALGAGLATAASLLTDSPADTQQIVLVTDGVNTEPTADPILAAQAAQQLGIQVQAIAIGQPGLVPFPQANGAVVFWDSPLNEAVLRDVAEAGGGFYGRATDETLMQQLTAQLLVATAVSHPPTTSQKTTELYPWFVAAGLLFLLTSQALRQTALRQLPEVA